MQPNLGNQLQFNPNLAQTPPVPEAIPEPNVPLTEEQWGNQQQDLNDLLFALRENHREEANIRAYVADGTMDPATAQQELNRVLAQRNGVQGQGPSIVGQIEHVAATSDTSAILDILDDNAGLARGHHSKLQNDLYGQDGMRDTAAATESGRRVEQARYHQTTRRIAHMPSIDPKSKDKADRDELERRAKLERRGLGQHAEAHVAASDAATNLSRSEYNHNSMGNYHGQLGNIAAYLRGEHNNRRADLEAVAQNTNAELRQWDIRQVGETYPGQEQQMRAELENMRMTIDQLSPHDALRAEALANYTRLRFRLESRGVMDDDANSTNQHNAQFTPDRGILLHKGDPDNEVIIYEDGTTERNGVRAWASGEEYVAPPASQDEFYIDAPASGRPVGEVFQEWEANRTPVTEAAAHASLRDHIDMQLQSRQQQVDAIGQYRQGVQAQRDFIRGLQQGAALENRTVNQAETQQITDAQKEIARLQGMEQTAQDNIGRLNEHINKANFWKSYMEVGKNRVEHTTTGRFITKQVISPVEGLAPEIHQNGAIAVYDATINGTRRDQWYIFRSGQSAYYDNASGSYKYFKANGEPL